MKIVCCKKCSAKYQLEDDDDISAFECTSCTGELELCDNGTQNKAQSAAHNNSNIVYCVECGSRYALSDKDNILEYECENCGGALRYVNEEMNRNIGKIINTQNQNGKFDSRVKSQQNSIKSISNKFGNIFSENSNNSPANVNTINEISPRPTARTRIPTDTQRRFGKEFLVPATNDYNILKEFLKEQFFNGMSQYYGMGNQDIPNGTYRNFTEEPHRIEEADFENEVQAERESLKSSKNVAIIIGGVIFIGSIGEILLFNNGTGIVAIFIGVIFISYGLYRKKDKEEEVIQKRSKVVREHLLSLPEDYYVFYDVKIPGSDRGINHLVIGPSGIYEILSQKFDPTKKSLEEVMEDDNVIGEINNPENIGSFRYTTKQARFQQDNKIKQEALKLGENLMNFLNKNGIRNCFVEPLVGFVNQGVVVINMPLTDEDLFIDELIHQIEYGSVKLDPETIDKCAVLLSRYALDCSLYEH